MKFYRIGIVGLSVEALIDSPLKTDASHMQIFRGAELVDADLWLVRGVFERLRDEPDFEPVPLLWSTALPGGALTADNYDVIKHEAIKLLLSNGPFDGVVVANHGALEVDGLDVQADADFVTAVRSAVGPDVPISVALDLHGHISAPLLEAANVFSALRTAPHRDDRRTGYRAMHQLVQVIRRGLRPKTAAVRIPILTAGEAAVTTSTPGAELYAALPGYDSRTGVMEANILVGFAYNDRPWTGMTALVTCEDNLSAAKAHVTDLANAIWRRRKDLILHMETAEVKEGLIRAALSAVKPVYMSDSGDNTTAGAPGDLTGVLQVVIANPDLRDVVVPGIYAPRLVRRALDLGRGRSIQFVLGDEHISGYGTRAEVTGVIEDGGEELVLNGFQPYRSSEGPWVRIRIGTTIATFHGLPVGITTAGHFHAMGINPLNHPIYVVKLGYLHPQLEDIAARHILLLSDGVVAIELTRRAWRRVGRPVYPIDDDPNWSPAAALYHN